MLSILLSKHAFLYYALVLVCEYVTRYGLYEAEMTGKKKALRLSKILSIGSVAFLVYYSLNTEWWAFIGLIAVNVIIFLLVNNIIKPIAKHFVTVNDDGGRRTFIYILKHI